MNRRIILPLGAIALTVGLAACSNISTEPDQVALHYSAGSLSSKDFKGCVQPGTRATSNNDNFFVYPAGSQRTFTADDAKAAVDGKPGTAEARSVRVGSKDGQELAAPVTVTFTLNTSCTPIKVGGKEYPGGVLQLFHETLGNRMSAYWNADIEGDASVTGVPEGWLNLLTQSVGGPLDKAADRVALAFDVDKLWRDPATKTVVETQLNTMLQQMVDQQMGAPVVGGNQVHFFNDIRASVGRFEPTNESLKEAVAQKQAAIAAADAATEKAKADVIAANAQVAVAKAKAASLAAERDALGAADWNAMQERKVREAAIEKGLNPWPAPVVVGAGGVVGK